MSQSGILKLLVVEDSATDAEVLSYYLNKSPHGFEIELTHDGQSALDMLRAARGDDGATPFDLVLLDLNLPKLGGFEVLHAIRTDPGLDGLPVVILTASVLEEDVERAHNLHADAYLGKPFDAEGYDEVVQAVERLLSSSPTSEA